MISLYLNNAIEKLVASVDRDAIAEVVGFGFVFAVIFVSVAHAQTPPTVSGGATAVSMLTNICNFILGTFGQTIAVLGIISIGLSWMFGRASLGLVAGVVGGIVIMFGASYLGTMLTGGTGTSN